MKIYSICIGLLWWIIGTGCSDTSSDSDKPPGTGEIRFLMETDGIYNFQDYIHTLTVYAFRQSSGGAYLFYKTVAELDQSEINALTSTSSSSPSIDAKILQTALLPGNYRLFFIANAKGNYTGTLEDGVTRPEDIRLNYPVGGLTESYFLGNASIQAENDKNTSLNVTLNRIVSKLSVKLYGVPEQIQIIKLRIGGIASSVDIQGNLSVDTTTASVAYFIENDDVYKTDTVRYELLLFPSANGYSDMDITFVSASGQRKVKQVEGLNLLPDKYLQFSGEINPDNGALLSFDILIRILVNNNWEITTEPDFPIKP